jgi:hypothetical protein
MGLMAGDPESFSTEKATVKKNDVDTYGQVFRKIAEPKKLLVLTGDRAFLVDVSAKTVHDVAINSIDDKSDPVSIDYGVLSAVEGAGLSSTRDSGIPGFSFTAKGDTYTVEMR